jgi:hypothetical protein
VRQDLQGLEISKGELKHLTGVDTEDLFRPASLKNAQTRFSFFFQELFIGLAITPIVVGFLYTFIIMPLIGVSVPAAIACLVLTPIATVIIRWFWLKRNSPQTLLSLLDEVDRYHAVIKAIDISDQIQDAGSAETAIRDRTTALQALQLTRSDLIRALRTERIFRENKDFMATNPEIFVTNLTALSALQVSDRGSEYGQFLDRALQIGTGIQAEMRKLQSSHSDQT